MLVAAHAGEEGEGRGGERGGEGRGEGRGEEEKGREGRED